MCGRYTRSYTWRQVREFLNVTFEGVPEMPPSHNQAPTDTVPIIRLNERGEREIAAVRWGFIPPWTKEIGSGKPLFNARAETVAEKPSYRSAFRARRCVVPVSEFAEWPELPGGGQQRVHIARADGAIMLLAGIWDRWDGGASGVPVESMAIITTEPNTFMRNLHDRMPAILEPEAVAAWLDPRTDAAAAQVMLVPAADGVLTARPVGEPNKAPKRTGRSLIQPDVPPGLFE